MKHVVSLAAFASMRTLVKACKISRPLSLAALVFVVCGPVAAQPVRAGLEAGHMRRLNLVLGGGVGTRMNLGRQSMYLQLTYGRGVLESGEETYWRSGLRTAELAFSIGTSF